MSGRLGVVLAAVAALAALGACYRPPPAPPVAAHHLPAPSVAVGDLDASVLFGDTPTRAARFGAGPLSLLASGEAEDGERLGAFVDVPPDVCLLAYARGSSSIEDLDIAAFDDDGSPLAVDEQNDAKPTVLLCPPHPPRVYIAAHVATGEGLVGVAAHLVPRDRAGEVGHALAARGALGSGPRPADGWPGLDDHVRAHHEALGGTWEEIKKAAIVLDARMPTIVSFPVEAEQCIDALVVPSEEVALVEVEAVDEAGRVIARAREGGADRSITLCSPMTVAGSLVLRPHVGHGLAAVVIARIRASAAQNLTARPDIYWTPTSVPLDAAKSERDDALTRSGYGAPTFATKGSLVLGRRASISLDVTGPAGTCTRVDVVGGAPLALLDARLRDAQNGLVASNDGAWGTTLFACARGKTWIDVETRGRGGPFAIVARPERWRDPSFTAHPRAAARMLARAAEGPMLLLEGTPSSTRAVTLDAQKVVVWTETVGANQCLQASVGAEGEGTGLELRVFDATSNDELDRSHAERAVSVRACAPATEPLAVRFELAATAGKLEAVVGERAR